MTTPSDEHDVTVVTICQGPPRCDLVHEEALAAQLACCPWCKHIWIDEDGSERCEEPGNA